MPGTDSRGVHVPSGLMLDLLPSVSSRGPYDEDRQALTALSAVALTGGGPTIMPAMTRATTIPPAAHSAIFHHVSTILLIFIIFPLSGRHRKFLGSHAACWVSGGSLRSGCSCASIRATRSSRSSAVNVHLNGAAVALKRRSKAASRFSTSARSVKSFGDRALRWTIE